MSTQKTDAEILRFLPLLGKEEKSSLLSVIKSFLSLINPVAAEEPPFDLDEYNHEIDEAEAEIEQEIFYTREEMDKKGQLRSTSWSWTATASITTAFTAILQNIVIGLTYRTLQEEIGIFQVRHTSRKTRY